MAFEVVWALGLSLAALATLAAFFAARRASLSARSRRLLHAVTSLLAVGTAFPLGSTALFLLIWGATGYCEDPGACTPRWWAAVGVALFVVFGGLCYLAGSSLKGYRRT